ncbi:hypothetical protein HMPREF0673_01112 [Leyella stercorea DSM 18206]|uniref:Uncharacterized protein n=1 Tax=Leyella stercorea DSM 18206 TaxID=1002367 RepID=G6AWW2_9BACT|nr:hypothetical protein HMPREF0673_01112 [Leyella stercorea DSM 18206]
MQIYIYNYVNIKLLLYFFVFDDSRLRVFQSAPTDADIRTDRRRHPHRPMQTSAPTDADIRIDRRRHPHRPTQMLVSTDADGLWRTFDVQKTALYD